MKYIIILLIALFGVFYYFQIKYRNNYKYFFIFGRKGSGKSCFMVHEMLKYLRKGWNIYTDMPVNLPNVRIISDPNSLFKQYTPEEHSVIFLDEIGITWHSREFKTFDKNIREWFKLQRKYKCRVYANSQTFDIDKGLRDLADMLILQTNIGNIISISRPILKGVTVTDPSFTGEAKIVDSLTFAKPWHYKFYFMPKYFKYFQSFDAPHRAPMPYTISEYIPDYKKLRKLGFNKRAAKKIVDEYQKSILSSSEASETKVYASDPVDFATSAPNDLHN